MVRGDRQRMWGKAAVHPLANITATNIDATQRAATVTVSSVTVSGVSLGRIQGRLGANMPVGPAILQGEW
jgi:hypothetical protein